MIHIGYAVVTSTCTSAIEEEYSDLEKEAKAHAEAHLENVLMNPDAPTYSNNGTYSINSTRDIRGILQNVSESADKWAIFPEIQDQVEYTPMESIPLYKIVRDSAEDRKLKKILPDLKGDNPDFRKYTSSVY